jgi:hypothetical protein
MGLQDGSLRGLRCCNSLRSQRITCS